MPSFNPYLTFNGDCEAAFNLYKSVFGGEFAFIGKFKDMPPMGEKKISEADGGKIMHVSLPIGRGTVLMGSDTTVSCGHRAWVGNNVSVSITADSEAEADKLFKGLSEGGYPKMPMAKAFWGAYFGMLTDKFGINWMINYDYKEGK